MARKPETLQAKTVARSRLFRVEQLDLRFNNGTEVAFERLATGMGGAVLVVAVTGAEELVLIREYAAGTDRYELGLPKGRVEPGEDPLAAANRELREETGFGARRLEPLHELTLAPGYMAHSTEIILARDLYEAPLPGDEPEPIEVVPWPIAELDELLTQPDLTEARSIAAIFLALNRLRGED
ncbi:ADP compounds hydrolase NudE [Arhodomonas aquaeolei]|uniref:ADP compounds hydrolase NudE n=1 Tax=Arhodomonas aquaeolei TaxID=2369 RepID=UPI000374D1B5|nr:ADP compounds hydrolase NudE [Arhodomonas aquaeolei]